MERKYTPLLGHHYEILEKLIIDNPNVPAPELAENYLRTLGEDLSLAHQYRLSPFSQPAKEAFRLGIRNAIQAIQRREVFIIPDSPEHSDVICQNCPVDDPGYCNRIIVGERQKKDKKKKRNI